MHASHEPVAPPSNGPSRGSRRRKVVASFLALFLMVAAALTLVARPQSATAQELPTLGTLTGQCVEGLAVFHFELVNPGAEPYTFAFQLTGSDGTANQSGETTLAVGETYTTDFVGEASAAPEWRVDILDPALGYPVVAQTAVVANPCGETSTTETTDITDTTDSTTETTDTTTDTTDTTTDTTDTTTETTTGTTTTGDTTTTDPSFPVVTTTTDAIAPVSSTGSGGGLAQTGVAIVVLIGAAGVLLFNGISLTRMTRPGWAKGDE